MRSLVSTAIVGLVSFAALAASTPPLAYELDTCESKPSTVFVTVQGVSTVTVHDVPTSTVYLSAPTYAVVQVSGVPTTTLTHFYTSTHTKTAAYVPLPTTAIEDGEIHKSKISYKTTVTKTAVVQTVYLTYNSVPSSAGPLSFMVSDGTTYWAGGVAPPSTESYIVVTSAVTVLPVVTPLASGMKGHTRTTTIHTTIVNSHQLTVTKTLPGQNVTATLIGVRTSAGTAIPFTSVSPGGWNASAGFGYGISVSRLTSSNGELVFPTSESSFDIYSTIPFAPLTASAAKSGFAALTTITGSSTSTANGVWTTAVVSGQTLSWGYGASTSTSYPQSKIVPRFSNFTSADLGMTISTAVTSGDPVSTTSIFEGYHFSNSTSAILISPTLSASTVVTSSMGSVSAYLNSTSVAMSETGTGVAISSATSPASYSNLSSVPMPTPTIADGVATSSTASLSGFPYSQPAKNSTTLVLSPSTEMAAGIAASSIPSSFLTIYSRASSSGVTTTAVINSNTTSTYEVASSSSTSFSSSVTYIYAAPPLSSFSSSTTSSAMDFVSMPSSSLSTVSPFSSSQVEISTSTSSSAPILSSSSDLVVSSSSYLSSTMTSASQTSTSTSLSTSSSAAPTQCGESGDFTLNFDDIPPLVATNETFNTVQPAPLFNPYHQFDFSDGFTVVPPPRDPYLPSSKPLLTEFIPNFNVNGSNPQSGPNAKEFGFSGDVGNGDHGLTGCFAFNFYGASFGCDSRDADCDFTFTGFRFDRDTKQTNQVAQQGYPVPACPALQDCTLTPVTFTNQFLDLDSIRINVTVANEPKIWWMDDLKLGWFNNTCAAGLCRLSTHIH